MCSRAARSAGSIGLVIATLLATACIDRAPLGPGLQAVVVHAVLNPAESRQLVVLHRSSGAGLGQSIRGARVSVIAPDGSVSIASERGVGPVVSGRPDSTGLYLFDASTLVTGRPYRLHIETVTGEVIDGTTTIPSVAAAPSAETVILSRSRDTLRLSWPRVAGARAYEVRLFVRGATSSSTSSEFIAYTDTSVALAGTAAVGSLQPFARPGTYDLVISAIDVNYYEYYQFTTDPFTGTSLPTSLTGAVGVFGALVPIVRRTVIVN